MPQNHLSAVETLRRSKPLSIQCSKFTDDSHLSAAVGTSSAQHSPQKSSFPASADITATCCTAPRAVNGKRRLSNARRDDSSSGGERQRKYCGSVQPKLLPDYQPNDHQPTTGSRMLTETNDSVISDYLSFKVEHMDLQSDVPSAGKPPSPEWVLPGKCVAVNSGTVTERKTHDTEVTARSFSKYRHGTSEVHRSSGRRCRRPFGSRAGISSRDANNSMRRRDDRKLETFFSHMGMDARAFSATLSDSPAVSAFENVSSIDTSTLESRTSYAESERFSEAVVDSFDVNERDAVASSSIVERNARIIKWLCSIRKASAGDNIQFDDGFV